MYDVSFQSKQQLNRLVLVEVLHHLPQYMLLFAHQPCLSLHLPLEFSSQPQPVQISMYLSLTM